MLRRRRPLEVRSHARGSGGRRLWSVRLSHVVGRHDEFLRGVCEELVCVRIGQCRERALEILAHTRIFDQTGDRPIANGSIGDPSEVQLICWQKFLCFREDDPICLSTDSHGLRKLF